MSWLVILVHTPVIYMFTPTPPTPTKSVSHLSSPLTHFFVLVIFHADCVCECMRAVCVAVCVYIWLGQLILSARKCPAARIWS